MPDVLLVMARKPSPGSVKTRLARTIGDEAACELYRAFLRDLHERFSSGPWRMMWAVEPAGASLADELGADVEAFDQRGADLSQRMWSAFADLFAIGGVERVVMIGADVPHLQPAAVEASFTALELADVVLVPTRDGGYCLVGLRRPIDLFTGVTMSTATVLRDTIDSARAMGLEISELPETFDIDEASDLADLGQALQRGELVLTHTAAALRRLGISVA